MLLCAIINVYIFVGLDYKKQPIKRAKMSGSEATLVITACDSTSRTSVDEVQEDDDPQGTTTGITLRLYQQELVERVSELNGANAVIVAPTNSGKTLVAADIIKNHFLVDPGSKVVFFAPNGLLAEQQSKALGTYMPRARIKVLRGDACTSVQINDLLEITDIIVMTPQILINAYDEAFDGDKPTFPISLMVFDECHHCLKKHPYSQLMEIYHLHLPGRPEPLPRVIGFTASVRISNSKMDSAQGHIFKLLANMDAQLVMVERRKADLALYCNPPEEVLVEAKDRFKIAVEIKPPGRKADLAYTQWLRHMSNNLISRIEDADFKHNLVSCTDYLGIYNNCLMLDYECRSIDAFHYLKEKTETLMMNEHPVDAWLAGLHKVEIGGIEDYFSCLRDENPWLGVLKEHIMKKKKPGIPMRCIVFCRTREICSALMEWANATEGLSGLKPGFITGSNAPAESKGLTTKQQNEAVQEFLDGSRQILFATSIVQEGIDVQECDNVIRYNFLGDMVARIQARGRARKSGATYTVLVTKQQDEQKNKQNEEKQNEALQRILQMPHWEFSSFLQAAKNVLLAELKNTKRDEEEKKQKHRSALREQGKDYLLICGHCSDVAFSCEDLRRINRHHHVVMDEDFIKDKVKLDSEKIPEEKWPWWFKVGRMYCKNPKCHRLWGPVCRYNNYAYPLPKIEMFTVVKPNGENMPTLKNWKDCPFFVERHHPESSYFDEASDTQGSAEAGASLYSPD